MRSSVMNCFAVHLRRGLCREQGRGARQALQSRRPSQVQHFQLGRKQLHSLCAEASELASMQPAGLWAPPQSQRARMSRLPPPNTPALLAIRLWHVLRSLRMVHPRVHQTLLRECGCWRTAFCAAGSRSNIQ